MGDPYNKACTILRSELGSSNFLEATTLADPVYGDLFGSLARITKTPNPKPQNLNPKS